MNMKNISLLRHGDINSENRYIGITDIDLSPVGEKQIRQLQEGMSTQKFDLILASPLKRCRQTFSLLGLDQEVHFDERLQEVDFGAWEGKTFAEIVAHDPTGVGEWGKGSADFRFPEGEKVADFQNRITDFAKDLYKLSGVNILIISHGGVIRHLICALLCLPFEKYLYFKIDYGRLTTIQLFDEGGILSGLNRRGV